MNFMIIIVFATSIWALIDAKNIMKDVPKEERKKITGLANTPLQWFFGCSLLWIVYFPLYLVKRSKYKEVAIVSNNQSSNCNGCSVKKEKPIFGIIVGSICCILFIIGVSNTKSSRNEVQSTRLPQVNNATKIDEKNNTRGAEGIEENSNDEFSDIKLRDIWNAVTGLTDIQWNEYVHSIEGKKIKWTGSIEDIKKDFLGQYKASVNADTGSMWGEPKVNYKYDVKVSEKDAGKLNKRDSIVFTATISSVNKVFGQGVITLTDAVYLSSDNARPDTEQRLMPSPLPRNPTDQDSNQTENNNNPIQPSNYVGSSYDDYHKKK